MPYTPLSLSLVWIFTLVIVGLAASGLASGLGLAALVLVALVMPATMLRLMPRPIALEATQKLRAR